MKVGVRCVSVVFAATLSASARGDSFVEVATGLAKPLAYDPDDLITVESEKLGVRYSTDLTRGFAVDMAIDWTPITLRYIAIGTPESFTIVTRNRFRLQGGIRWTTRVDHDLHLFIRASAGVDEIRPHGPRAWRGASDDAGIALELGTGALLEIGPWLVGGQVAVPFADHGKTTEFIDYTYDHYRAFDLDLLPTIAHRL